ncbi:MAG: phosphoglycerate dehydrogenase, partial [Nanoarchaeota archaeon]
MRLLITDNIAKNAIEILKENFDVELKIGLSEEELISIIPSYEIIIVRSSIRLTDRVISAGKSLKIIARPGVGVDNIDTKSATKNCIVVINTPLGNINAAAELTIGMILSLARSVHNANFSLR